jgi:hypothetical protein
LPLVAACDDHERVWLPPAPVLFQRRIGAEDRAIPAATIRKILAAQPNPRHELNSTNHPSISRSFS